MIIHIGYPKTGTTYLQNSVFPSLEGIKYFNYYESDKVLRSLSTQSTFEFCPELEKNNFFNRDNALYSLECLVGKMGVGTYNFEIAQRLYKVGFKKVIITIRNQKTILESLYRQYIQQGGVVKAKLYFNEDNNLFKWSYLYFHDLISHYSNIFGKKNVLVILQEDIKNRESEVVSKIIKFVGAYKIKSIAKKRNVNKSLSSISIKLLRIINHFTYNYYRRSNLISNRITTYKFRFLLQNYLDPLIIYHLNKNKKLVPIEIQKKAEKIYRSQNEKLDKEFDLGLKEYGYY